VSLSSNGFDAFCVTPFFRKAAVRPLSLPPPQVRACTFLHVPRRANCIIEMRFLIFLDSGPHALFPLKSLPMGLLLGSMGRVGVFTDHFHLLFCPKSHGFSFHMPAFPGNHVVGSAWFLKYISVGSPQFHNLPPCGRYAGRLVVVHIMNRLPSFFYSSFGLSLSEPHLDFLCSLFPAILDEWIGSLIVLLRLSYPFPSSSFPGQAVFSFLMLSPVDPGSASF